MKKKKMFAYLLIGIIIGFFLMCRGIILPDFYQFVVQEKETIIQPFKKMSPLEEMSGNIKDVFGRVQYLRIEHLQNACANESLFLNKSYTGRSQVTYQFSTQYNFSYCDVPKAGSSFWTQMLAILQNGLNDSADVFEMPRDDIHIKLKQYRVPFKGQARKQSRTLIVSRDPYSRLFSGFIDKMYLPTFYKETTTIVKKQRGLPETEFVCPNNITFQEFLKYNLDKAYRGETLNRHWTPIFSLCKPCDVQVFALVKQESFSVDVEYVLKELGVTSDQFETISDALHNHRTETTITGILKTVVGRQTSCIDELELARRIWVSFQIQGFIKDNIAFPIDSIDTKSKAKNASFLTDIILKSIRQNPLTSEESKAQRHRALVNAYAGVSKKVIESLKSVYMQDFILFDYSLDPPSLR